MFLPCEHDPFVRLDRRWARAGYLAARRRVRWHPSDDFWVQQAVRFRKALARCRGERARRNLAERMPALHLAYAIHQADPPPLRWAVEARLLAAEPFADIARKCATSTAAITTYAKLFFDATDRLDSSDWIVCQAIGPKAHVGMTENDLDVVWKLFGYAHGPLVLDALIDYNTGRARPETPEQVDPHLARDTRSLLLRKLAVAALLLPVTPETAAAVLLLASRLGPVEPGTAAVNPAVEVLVNNVEAVVINPLAADGETDHSRRAGPGRAGEGERETAPAGAWGGREPNSREEPAAPNPIRRRMELLASEPAPAGG